VFTGVQGCADEHERHVEAWECGSRERGRERQRERETNTQRQREQSTWSTAMASVFMRMAREASEMLRGSLPMISGAATIDQIAICVRSSSSEMQSLPVVKEKK
jgi:hypothetical protein